MTDQCPQDTSSMLPKNLNIVKGLNNPVIHTLFHTLHTDFSYFTWDQIRSFAFLISWRAY